MSRLQLEGRLSLRGVGRCCLSLSWVTSVHQLVLASTVLLLLCGSVSARPAGAKASSRFLTPAPVGGMGRRKRHKRLKG